MSLIVNMENGSKFQVFGQLSLRLINLEKESLSLFKLVFDLFCSYWWFVNLCP